MEAFASWVRYRVRFWCFSFVGWDGVFFPREVFGRRWGRGPGWMNAIVSVDFSYLKVPIKQFAEVVGLNPQEVLVDFPLLLAAGDGQVGENV